MNLRWEDHTCGIDGDSAYEVEVLSVVPWDSLQTLIWAESGESVVYYLLTFDSPKAVLIENETEFSTRQTMFTSGPPILKSTGVSPLLEWMVSPVDNEDDGMRHWVLLGETIVHVLAVDAPSVDGPFDRETALRAANCGGQDSVGFAQS